MIFEIGDLVVGKKGNNFTCADENCVLKVTKVLEDHSFLGMYIYHTKEKFKNVVGAELTDAEVAFKVEDFRLFDKEEDSYRLHITENIETLIKIAELKNEIIQLKNCNINLRRDVFGMEKEIIRLRSKLEKIKDIFK